MLVVVVEGNTPEVEAGTIAAGGTPAAAQYAAALAAVSAEAGIALETRILRPSWPGYAPSAAEFEGAAGVAFTGSGVSWSADAPEAATHRAVMERAFAAGLPVVGSCYGLQLGAVVLGGSVRWSPNGLELMLARHIRLTPEGRAHPLHAGRPASFDCTCIHRDEVHRVPGGAVVTAGNDHSPVQAMVYERGGVRFWGFQYHPELRPDDPLRYMGRGGTAAFTPSALFADAEAHAAMLAEVAAAVADPAAHPGIAWRYGLGPDVTDPRAHRTELSNWVASVAAARADAA